MGLGVHFDLVLVIDDSETVVALDHAVRGHGIQGRLKWSNRREVT